MRCFIAINLDESLKEEITKTVAELKKKDCDVAWVSQEGLHITLRFLGETSDSLAAAVQEKLSGIACLHEQFALTFHGLGIFPEKGRPRVLWVDIRDSERLMSLQQEVETATETLGFDRERRPFSPHVTIGRIRSPQGTHSLINAVETRRERVFGTIEVRSIDLMKSELKPTGARYSTIAGFPLLRRSNDQ